MAYIVRADGTSFEFGNGTRELRLTELHRFVGGHIEVVKLNHNTVMVVNEEGKLLDLPVNEVATLIYRLSLPPQFFTDPSTIVVGDVVIARYPHEVN